MVWFAHVLACLRPFGKHKINKGVRLASTDCTVSDCCMGGPLYQQVEKGHPLSSDLGHFSPELPHPWPQEGVLQGVRAHESCAKDHLAELRSESKELGSWPAKWATHRCGEVFESNNVTQTSKELEICLENNWITLLVGGWPTPLKNMSQLGWLFPIYGKNKMFQTTNQHWIIN